MKPPSNRGLKVGQTLLMRRKRDGLAAGEKMVIDTLDTMPEFRRHLVCVRRFQPETWWVPVDDTEPIPVRKPKRRK